VISLEFLLVLVKEYDSEEVSRLLPMVKSCGQEERGGPKPFRADFGGQRGKAEYAHIVFYRTSKGVRRSTEMEATIGKFRFSFFALESRSNPGSSECAGSVHS
jgi:hypothetical protein